MAAVEAWTDGNGVNGKATPESWRLNERKNDVGKRLCCPFPTICLAFIALQDGT